MALVEPGRVRCCVSDDPATNNDLLRACIPVRHRALTNPVPLHPKALPPGQPIPAAQASQALPQLGETHLHPCMLRSNPRQGESSALERQERPLLFLWDRRSGTPSITIVDHGMQAWPTLDPVTVVNARDDQLVSALSAAFSRAVRHAVLLTHAVEDADQLADTVRHAVQLAHAVQFAHGVADAAGQRHPVGRVRRAHRRRLRGPAA